MKNKKVEKEEYLEDDGRTVVDMSGVEKLSMFGNRALLKKWEAIDENEKLSHEFREQTKNPSWMKQSISFGETKYHILGALKAGLLIWLVYALSFGGFLLALTMLFKYVLK